MAASMGMGREMIDWTKPIETMEGWPAKVVSRDYKTVTRTLFLVQIERPFSGRTSLSCLGWYQEDGRPWETERHIRNAPVKREGWVNIYGVYKTEEDAKRACVDPDRNCHRFVRWEE